VIHRKKNRPALQSHDILTIFVVFVVVVVVVVVVDRECVLPSSF